MDKDQKNIVLLAETWQLLKISEKSLVKSKIKCSSLILKKKYSFEDEESFDSLTSKFGRTSDLYTQKVLRTIRLLLHEPFVPFIDNMNELEKIGIIFSADEMIEIRDLRNQITHEYLPEAIKELVPDVLRLTKKLEKNIGLSEKFLSKRGWLEEK